MLKRIAIFLLLSPLYFLGLVLLASFGMAAYLWFQIPSESTIRGCLVTTMFHVELCPTAKNYIPISKMSRFLPKAIIVAEDAKFYDHQGFDWESIETNAKEVIEKGNYKRGGSTITQQLAKNMFLYKEKSLYRKGIEALITWKIERTLTKKEILEKYLNVVEFGKNIYGVKEACQFYFKKTPSQVNAAEAAFLAMLLPNPIKYSRSYYKKDLTKFAKRRVSQIVGDLYGLKQISDEDFLLASAQVEDFFGTKPPPPPPISVESGNADEPLSLDAEESEVPTEE